MTKPVQSFLAPEIPNASFVDSFYRVMELPEKVEAVDVYLQLMIRTPEWVETLMSWRNSIVSKIGLKHLGNLSDFTPDLTKSEYQTGDKMGIFTLRHISPQEVVVEDRDKHLNVSISLYLEPLLDGKTRIYVTTVVQVNNLLGHVYMLFVAPMHKLIVPASLRQLPSTFSRVPTESPNHA